MSLNVLLCRMSCFPGVAKETLEPRVGAEADVEAEVAGRLALRPEDAAGGQQDVVAGGAAGQFGGVGKAGYAGPHEGAAAGLGVGLQADPFEHAQGLAGGVRQAALETFDQLASARSLARAAPQAMKPTRRLPEIVFEKLEV